jgi:hypothetical protein
MAQVLKSFDFPETTRSGKHDWTALTDGAIRELKRGEDFSGKPKWFAVQCRMAAKKRGLKVRLSKVTDDSDKIVVQFIQSSANGEQQEQQQAPTKSKK